jgi:signal recognition particle GTPase
MEKLTKRQVIEKMLKEDFVVANVDYVNYLQNELRLLDNKKNANSAKAKANAEENAKLADTLVKILTNADKVMTITEILAIPEVASIRIVGEDGNEKPLSTSKVSYILNNDDRVVRTENKKKAYFSIK